MYVCVCVFESMWHDLLWFPFICTRTVAISLSFSLSLWFFVCSWFHLHTLCPTRNSFSSVCLSACPHHLFFNSKKRSIHEFIYHNWSLSLSPLVLDRLSLSVYNKPTTCIVYLLLLFFVLFLFLLLLLLSLLSQLKQARRENRNKQVLS